MPKPVKLSRPERSKGGQNPPNTSWERPPDPKGSGGAQLDATAVRIANLEIQLKTARDEADILNRENHELLDQLEEIRHTMDDSEREFYAKDILEQLKLHERRQAPGVCHRAGVEIKRLRRRSAELATALNGLLDGLDDSWVTTDEGKVALCAARDALALYRTGSCSAR